MNGKTLLVSLSTGVPILVWEKGKNNADWSANQKGSEINTMGTPPFSGVIQEAVAFSHCD